MEPLFQKIPLAEDQSILIKDTFNTNFHFHGEYELIYFSEGAGECIVGDRISSYKKGNMFLIAPNLPHCFTGAPGTNSKSLVLQFRHKAFLGTIENHPELESINRLLAKAEKGLLFQSDSRLLDSKIIHSSGFERFIALLDVLNKLSHTDDCRVLCGPAYTQNVKLKDYHRINEVYGYVADHFHSKISLEKIAGELHLNVSSFCRYFKKITKKSFFTYLNEYRVGKACDMLKRSDKRVAAICYESGFESIANFNRQFKKYIEMSPSAYRKHYSMKA